MTEILVILLCLSTDKKDCSILSCKLALSADLAQSLEKTHGRMMQCLEKRTKNDISAFYRYLLKASQYMNVLRFVFDSSYLKYMLWHAHFSKMKNQKQITACSSKAIAYGDLSLKVNYANPIIQLGTPHHVHIVKYVQRILNAHCQTSRDH